MTRPDNKIGPMEKYNKIFKENKLVHHLSTTIFLSFLGIALIPMLIVMAISYNSMHKALFKDAERSLKAVAIERKAEILSHFDGIVRNLKLQAELKTNTKFMISLSEGLKNHNRNASDYVSSYKWAKLVDEQSSDIDVFRRTYNYSNIFFIEPGGNILYSVTQKGDLGTNIFTGNTLSGSKFSKACRKALDTGRQVFSGYEPYAYAQNKIFGFLTAPILNYAGDIVGLIAFQYPVTQINDISQRKMILGKTAEFYLVGTDLTLRSGSIFDNKMSILKTKVKTRQALLWQEEYNAHNGIASHQNPTLIYKGLHGDMVLGTHNDMHILDVPIGIITEITTEEAFQSISKFKNLIIWLSAATVMIVFALALILSRRIVQPVLTLSRGATKIANGDYTGTITVKSKNEIGHLSWIFNEMTRNLDQAKKESDLQNWINEGRNQLNNAMRNHDNLETLCTAMVGCLAKYFNAHAGGLYLPTEKDTVKLTGRYAYSGIKKVYEEIPNGEGMIGQAVLDKQIKSINNLPENYMIIASGFGKTKPKNIVVCPVMRSGKVTGVLELASLNSFSPRDVAFLELISENMAIAINSMHARHKEKILLERVQTQHEELQAANEELEEQTVSLRTSEEELKTQSEELRAANEELTEKTKQLYRQQEMVEKSKLEIAQKAVKLEETGKYKSEFMANMSHELRSPLNSLLILSQNLTENEQGNLTDDQVTSAQIINNSGRELLDLINDILDLSKIEAGRLEILPEKVDILSFLKEIKKQFQSQTDKKGLSLTIAFEKNLPADMITDAKRLRQIVNNFVSNAIKFTKEGSVTIKAHRPSPNTKFNNHLLSEQNCIGVSVIDTGIGIPSDKHPVIFDAFIQADGTTTREYGGTGLGLSISKQLVHLLGGDLFLISEEGKGSTFTMYLPLEGAFVNQEKSFSPHPSEVLPAEKILATAPEEKFQERVYKNLLSDDREKIKRKDDKVLLIIEDDIPFAEIVQEMGKKKGYKTVICTTGREGLVFAFKHLPTGIVLDLGLPDIDGNTVLESLKQDAATCNIPIHIISGRDDFKNSFKENAVGYLLKPATKNDINKALDTISASSQKDIKKILLVEDDPVHQQQIGSLLENENIDIQFSKTGNEAVEHIMKTEFQCVILDLVLPDMNGFDVLKQVAENDDKNALPPVIIYTAKDLSQKEMNRLLQYARKVIPKSLKGSQRLVDEVSLFLHSMESALPLEQRKQIDMLHDDKAVFKDKKILLVDDDMRNIFAMSGLLQRSGMRVTMAENGVDALQKIDENQFDIILMDIMMPKMDGYEATRKIRELHQFKKIPIIALTAKAMPEDREKCIKAGVNDYLSKPVDKDQLFSMLKVWLYA